MARMWRCPGVKLAEGDPRLREVVDHERLLRQEPHQFDGGGQLLHMEQQVVGEAVRVELPDAAQEGLPEHEPRVGLVLHHMPHADERRVRRQCVEVVADAVAPQVHPADHALHERMGGGQVEQPAALRDALPGLHGDGAVDPLGGHQGARSAGR